MMHLHGSLAQWKDATALRHAHDALRRQGYTRVEVFTPWPVDALAVPPSRRMAPAALAAFVVGFAATMLLQWYSASVDYPVNVGGRPTSSWPAFVPGAIEVGMLFAALMALVAFMASTGLPKLYRPEFHVPWFEEASRDGFLLLVRADDPHWDEHRCARDLEALHPLRFATVPA